MAHTLTQVAQQLFDKAQQGKKAQLIYAFNGTGKTRLSKAFKELVAPKDNQDEEPARNKILYYNAFTEDLFAWDNDLQGDTAPKLDIRPNTFTDWILGEEGRGNEIIENFQHYTNEKLTPVFFEKDVVIGGRATGKKTYPHVTFSFERGDDKGSGDIKISKGEESNFIWSFFYTLLEQIVDVLKKPELEDRETEQFNDLEYIFIDDPVSSLDENHLIELAQDLATLISNSPQDGPKFIITTHNPLFYNVLWNALNGALKYRLLSNDDGSFDLESQRSDSPFSYHLHLMEKLKNAVELEEFEKFHYNFLRNILEKTATFLGYGHWSELLPSTGDGTRDRYLKRIVDISSHSKHSGYELAELSKDDKRVLKFLVGQTANKQYEFPEKYHLDLKDDEANE